MKLKQVPQNFYMHKKTRQPCGLHPLTPPHLLRFAAILPLLLGNRCFSMTPREAHRAATPKGRGQDARPGAGLWPGIQGVGLGK